MSLATGSKLGPYEIVAPLGAGGMGEVYRARDTRLDRTVAIKVLPHHLSENADLKQRFEREARAISSLNHPNICTLHDIGHDSGIDFLVLEYIEGESLAERLGKGPLPVKEVLRIGSEIAEALDRAHRAGIVHRDLKPGNIMLTKSGAKLLDFGLAKPQSGFAASAAHGAITQTSPVSPITQQGSLVGTFQYMSPEQVEGREADARSDIFALGAVLYEMATGRRAFDGKSQISVASAILEKDPEPISAVLPASPPALDHVIRTCLAKDPEQRYQTAHDVKLELRWIGDSGVNSAGLPLAPTRRGRERLVWAAAVLALIGIAAALLWRTRSTPPEELIRAYFPVPANAQFVIRQDDTAGPAVISPDGQFVAFVATDPSGNRGVWLEPLREGKAHMLAGTDGGTYPFWSPDSKWIGFFAQGKLKKVPLDGGPVMALADAARGRGGSCNQFGDILYAPTTQSGIYLVPASGGEAKRVVSIDTKLHTTDRWPVWLPDGKRFLYLATNHGHPEASQTNGIYVASVNGNDSRMLMPSDSNAILAPGYLLFVQHGILMAQAFDASAVRLKGDPSPVADDVIRNSGTWRAAADASRNGIIVFQSGASRSAQVQLQWLSPKGAAVDLGSPDYFYQLRLSPDGKRLGASIGDPQSVLTVIDLTQNSRTRLTFEGTADDTFAWSPDGSRIALGQRHAGPIDIYLKNSSGSGPEQLLYASPFDKYVTDWSPDGRDLLFSSQGTGTDPQLKLFVLPLEGDRKPQVFLEAPAPFNISQAQFSPDGKWVAYVSNETGRTEIYLTNFPKPNGKWQVSTAGGSEVRWARDQQALFFLDSDGRTVMRAPVRLEGQVASIGEAHPYIKTNVNSWSTGMSYDVAGDGRILAENAIGDDSQTITLLIHWKAALKK